MTAEQHYFLVSQRLMPPHFTCLDYGGLSILQIVLRISWAGSYVPMLHSIGHDNDLVSWLTNGDV